MRKITIFESGNNSLPSIFLSLYESLKNTTSNEKIEFDLSKIKWFYPILLLPLSAYITATKSRYINNNVQNQSYLDTINFPYGIDSTSSFQQQIQRSKKLYSYKCFEKRKLRGKRET